MNKLTVIFFATIVSGIGVVTYNWAAWTTETLISVDKKTEVITTEISHIKRYMERDYGSIQRSDETASVKALQ